MPPTSNTQSTQRRVGSRSYDESALIATVRAVALTLTFVALWAATHVYKGLTGDAELYAVQALARIRSGLATDLYLRYGSQDHFTIFSPLYSWCIRCVGLHGAALSLFLILTVWFLIAAWVIARQLSTTAAAFMAVSSLIVISGTYGSWEVFSYSENWLTARTLAEALVVTGIACHYVGRKNLGGLICAAALAIHPIMALPGLLLLLCIRLPVRTGLMGASLGIVAVVAVALAASIHPKPAGMFSVMDQEWLEVVHERSQFLFLQYWTVNDWEVNARPFLCLTFTAVATDKLIRRLCIAAITVGATGLVVAAITGLIGPVAIMLQGQAWRWVWITSFTSVLLIAPTALKVWRDEKCGPLCALLLVLGWTFSVMDGDACIALALGLWLARDRISGTSARNLRWAAAALGGVVIAWIFGNTWTVVLSPSPETGRDPLAIADLRNILGLGASAVLAVLLLYYCITTTRSIVILALISTLLTVGAAFALPGALMQNFRYGTPAEINEFAEWRSAIPATATVYVAPAHNSAAFAWFTLERPGYLSLDQSAGVVFSRTTALEVKRRSQVLLPVLDPDWQVLSRNQHEVSGKNVMKASSRPLTQASLVSVCGDPVLDFVVAKESLGFDALRHTHSGTWKDFYLYDCRRVRSWGPSA
jgi:hypothetical protein